MTDTLREAFEAQAGPMGFDLTRQYIAVPEPWAEYVDEQTGYFWAGWQAGAQHEREACAKICEGANENNMTALACAIQIRDRGTP